MSNLNSTIIVGALTVALSAGAAFAETGNAGHGHGAHGAAAEKAETGHGAHGGGGHGAHGGGHATMNVAVGEKGDPADARRTMHVIMTDNEYSRRSITVTKGETVRFIVENKGEFVHEFNIGTAEMHKGHQAEMMTMMESGALEADKIVHAKMGGGMMHDDPNSVLLEPGQQGEVVWKFVQSGEIEFACNVPGHYEAGMRGKLKIR